MTERIDGHLEIDHNEAGDIVLGMPSGNILLSPDRARMLASELNKRASIIEQEQRAKAEAERIAALPPVDRSARVLTDGSPITPDHRDIDPATGQQKGYVVLSAEERAKGFVRPLRRSYVHKKCGTVTTMGTAIAETYARDPTFYTGTFCCQCRAHFPLSEFVWDGTDQQVGS